MRPRVHNGLRRQMDYASSFPTLVFAVTVTMFLPTHKNRLPDTCLTPRLAHLTPRRAAEGTVYFFWAEEIFIRFTTHPRDRRWPGDITPGQ